jgi:hypothetical protein
MNWKVFTTAFVSLALLSIPENGFTCGASEDPYDYYTSFFSNHAATGKEYKPFYYTSLLTFYDEWEQDSATYEADKVLQEWMAYCKTSSLQDADELIYKSSADDVLQLAKSLGSGAPLPASLKTNSLAKNIVQEKKSEAVRYLGFAKKTAALSPASAWDEAPKRDSLQLNKYLAEATELFSKSADVFFKNKWAFQRCKVAFYNHRYNDCSRFYDDYFNEANTSAVNALAYSYKAGSLYRSGKKKEAAYLFSKAFAQSDEAKKQNYLGFWWASDNCSEALIPAYTTLCKNNLELANMLGMFGMYGTSYKLDAMQKVYELNAGSPLLPLLATREIHKLEEQYLTPLLENEKGGKALYVSYADLKDENNKTKASGQTQAIKTAQLFEKIANDKTTGNRAFYGLSAAYLHFISKDYDGAKTLLAKTKDAQPDAKVKEQAQLMTLLVAANEAKTLTKETEAQLLPSIKWLVQKAKEDKEYSLFCRNFFSQILAQKYERQNDAARAALAYAMADLAFIKNSSNEGYQGYSLAIDFVRNEMNTDALLVLYNLMTSPTTETEKFFMQNGSVKRDAVIDVIGTSQLRDRAYAKAIEWLGKAGKLEPMTETVYNYTTGKERKVNVDPFYDYLNDWQRYSKSVSIPYTKLMLAKKLLDLQKNITSIDTVADKARLYYTYANALYNISYYGNSWSAVAYDRSGVDWNEGTYKTIWEKDYFGVYEARAYYQKAYDVASSKEYKAACLFMLIKCAQRQIPRPAYDYKNEAAAEKAEKDFERQFKYNPLFAKFKSEFEATKFYPYVYNRCSYLRDYVTKSGTSTKAPASAPKKKG